MEKIKYRSSPAWGPAKRALLVFLGVATPVVGAASGAPQAGLPRLRADPSGRFLVKADGGLFFWLGDTAWSLPKVDDADVSYYLANRARKGSTGIQVNCGFSESWMGSFFNGRPYSNDDTDTPNEAYWQHVDFIVDEAGRHGIYVALTVMWGEQFDLAFGSDAAKANRLGQWLGARYAGRTNVLWIVSGEYDLFDSFPISPRRMSLIQATARGLEQGHGNTQLMTVHPSYPMTSSIDFHASSWLDFNMLQSGHLDDSEAWGYPDNHTLIASDYALGPPKPVVDGEPAYENHVDGYWLGNTNGPRIGDAVVRRKAYRSVFAGAFGHTYGHNEVQVFYVPGEPPVSVQSNHWKDVLDAPGAAQMRHLCSLLESRSFPDRIPDQSVLISDTGSGIHHVQCSRSSNGTWVMVYVPTGAAVTVDMTRLAGSRVAASWFDPRTGASTSIGTFSNSGASTFDAPGGVASGNDWVLLLESRRRRPPGRPRGTRL